MGFQQIVTSQSRDGSKPFILGIEKFVQLASGGSAQIEVSVDDYRKLPALAQRKGAVTAAEFDRLVKLEEEIRAQLGYFSAADAMTREELYDLD